MKHGDKAERAQRGFTLVEMLVVLAILSVLAAILFAAFSGVRERGRQTVCAANLKQIGLAFSLYADDNAQILPPVMAEDAHRTMIFWPQVVLPYLKTRASFVCPTDFYHPSQLPDQQLSYGYNQYIGGGLGSLFIDPRRDDLAPRTQAQIVRPSATLLAADSGTTATEGLPSSRWPVLDPPPFQIGDAFTHIGNNPVTAMLPAPYARHQGRVEILWADGHVSALPLDAFYNAPDHKRPQDKFTGISPCFRPDMGCD